MDAEHSAKEHVLLAMLARAAEAKGVTRERAIALAESALSTRIGMKQSAEKALAMFDEVEAAATAEVAQAKSAESWGGLRG